MSMNSFFKSQFSYCPLIWMCHSRTINNKISYLQERCLRVIYNDKVSSFKELLERNKSHCVKSVQIRSFFWSLFSRIRTECIFPYSIRMRENTDQKKLYIWTHFTQCLFQYTIGIFRYLRLRCSKFITI